MRLRALLVLAAALALPAAAVAAKPQAQSVSGHIHSQQVVAGCTSPIGLCTAGTFTGKIHGDFTFTATRLEPSDTPGVFFYTGTIAVHSNQGDLHCTDAGVFDFALGSDGELVDLCTATGGTGRWQGASGYIQIVGTFTIAAGGDSDYVGKIATV